MFLLLLRIIFDFTIFPTQIHRVFLHHFFAYRVFLPHFCHFSTTLCFFPKKIRIFLSFCFFLVFLFTIGSSFCSTSLSISWITLLLPLYPSRSALVSKRNFGMTCYSSCFECFIVSQKVHLVDEKSRGNFKKSGYFAFGCFCLFLREPVDAKTPDIYCSSILRNVKFLPDRKYVRQFPKQTTKV